MSVLAIDFGTSNSAAAALVDGAPRILELEPGAQTLPTALFFDFEERDVLFGTDAEQALFDGAWGRYMRALKSLLGTSLIHESTAFLGKRKTYLQIVAEFLAEMKRRAEAQTGQRFSEVISGRPVRFHNDAARHEKALNDLRASYHQAGFDHVSFIPEPEAAALARRAVLGAGELGLVVDIGGGTSDFTLFETMAKGGIDVLHSEGLRLGGTDFDRLLSFDHVMPMAGRGSRIKHAFGSDTHLAPNAIFADLATWQKIPFLYTADTRNAAKELAKYASEPAKLARLVRVLEDERGHDLAFAVEAAKIAVNAQIDAEIALDALEPKLRLPLTSAALSHSLGPSAAEIGAVALRCVSDAGHDPEGIQHLVLVGGSSLIGDVKVALRQRFPSAQLNEGGALTGIIEGLGQALL